jgi:hypothetical protein
LQSGNGGVEFTAEFFGRHLLYGLHLANSQAVRIAGSQARRFLRHHEIIPDTGGDLSPCGSARRWPRCAS